MLRNRQTPHSRANSLSWLLLALLAWSQLALAAHQFDHSMADAGDTCAVCLQFERNDDAPVDTLEVSLSPPPTTPVPEHLQAAFRTYAFSHYASRASP